MFIVSRLGDVITLYIGMFLVPDIVDQEKLGAVLPLTKLATFIAFPLIFFQSGALKFINVFYQRGEIAKVRRLIRDVSLLACALSAIVILGLWFTSDWLMTRLQIDDSSVMLVIAFLVIMSFWAPLAGVATQSLKRFKVIIASRLVAPIARLVVMLLLLQSLQLTGVLLAQLASIVAVFLLSVWSVSGLLRGGNSKGMQGSYRENLQEMKAYTIPVGIYAIVYATQQAAEPWFVREVLSNAESAAFYIIATFGQIPLWLAPAILPFLFPEISERHERGENTFHTYLKAMFLTCLLGFGCVLFFFLFAGIILDLREKWAIYTPYAIYIPYYALIITLSTMIMTHITYQNACRKYGYVRILASITMLEVIALVGMTMLNASGIADVSLNIALASMLIIRVMSVGYLMFDAHQTRPRNQQNATSALVP